MEEYAEDVKTLALTSDVFGGIVSRWEQNTAPPPITAAEEDKTVADNSTRWDLRAVP